jgi:hypothetical protein
MISAIATIIILCGAWGCLIAVFIIKSPENLNKTIVQFLEKKKKKIQQT